MVIEELGALVTDPYLHEIVMFLTELRGIVIDWFQQRYHAVIVPLGSIAHGEARSILELETLIGVVVKLAG